MSCKHGVDLAYHCSRCGDDLMKEVEGELERARIEDSYYYKYTAIDGGIRRDHYYPSTPPVPVTQDDIRFLRSEVYRLTQLVEKLIGIFSPDQTKT